MNAKKSNRYIAGIIFILSLIGLFLVVENDSVSTETSHKLSFVDKSNAWTREHYFKSSDSDFYIKPWDNSRGFLSLVAPYTYTTIIKLKNTSRYCASSNKTDGEVHIRISSLFHSTSHLLENENPVKVKINSLIGEKSSISIKGKTNACQRIAIHLSSKKLHRLAFIAYLATISFIISIIGLIIYRSGWYGLGIVGAGAIILTVYVEHSASPISYKEILGIIAFSAFPIFVAIWILSISINFKKKWLPYLSYTFIYLVIVIYLLPSIVELMQLITEDGKMDYDDWVSIIQSTPEEALEYLINFYDKKYIFITITAFVIGFSITKWRSPFKTSSTSPVIPFALGLAAAFILFYSPTTVEAYAKPVKIIKKYNKELSRYKRHLKHRRISLVNNGKSETTFRKKERGETYLVVIGESLNKNHMSLYGYNRDTNPKLRKISDELYIHQHAFSNHVRTMQVLKLALTSANQHNQDKYHGSPSIIDAANSAGFDTYWISNQRELGYSDTPITMLSSAAKHQHRIAEGYAFNHSNKTDEALLPYVKNALDKNTNRNKLIFLHLIGNHSNYCARYSKKYKVYTKKSAYRSKFEKPTSTEKIKRNLDCYDNSVLFNDHIISHLIDTLNSAGEITGLLYFSDHGENLVPGKGHRANNFRHDMTEIPLLFWFSSGYKAMYSEKMKILARNLNRPFSNGFIYDTLLDMISIETSEKSSSGSLFSKHYIPHDYIMFRKYSYLYRSRDF